MFAPARRSFSEFSEFSEFEATAITSTDGLRVLDTGRPERLLVHGLGPFHFVATVTQAFRQFGFGFGGDDGVPRTLTELVEECTRQGAVAKDDDVVGEVFHVREVTRGIICLSAHSRRMDGTPHVVGVSGSLRERSHTRKAVNTALRGAATAGATAENVDLRNYNLPVFDGDSPDAGDAPELRERVREADSVVLGTPMYHGSYSAPLKNALDYCGFDEFEDKTVGLVAVAGGRFPVTALEHLRSVCRALNAWVVPQQAAVPNSSSSFDNEGFVDDQLAERVERVGQLVVRFAGVGEANCFEASENVGAD